MNKSPERAEEIWGNIRMIMSDAWLKIRRDIQSRDERRTRSAFPKSRRAKSQRGYRG
jgi:hypothetical protein